MRTDVEIVAAAHRSLRFRCSGGLAVRQTGPTAAHLIGTAATPLGGDHIDITVHVEAGAVLDLGSVAATIALPTRSRPDSTAHWSIRLDEGARLRLDPQPTVVAGGADHRSDIVVELAHGATLDLYEHVQIGRSAQHFADDATGRWSGGLHIDVGGAPLLRHRLELGAGSTAAPVGMRAMSSAFRYPDARGAQVDSANFAARLDLVGGATLTTALDRTVSGARGLCDALDVAALVDH